MLPGVDCAKSTAPNHPHLVVTSKGFPCKPRKTFCFTQMCSGNDYGVYNNSLSAIERAVKERVFFVDNNGVFTEPDRPTPQQFQNCVQDMTNQFKIHAQYTTPMKAQHFAESYQGRRREVYITAVAQNLALGFSDKLAHVIAFIKAEKYNFTRKANAVPRIIQPRDSRFIVETGRYIKPIEKKVYNVINTVFGATTVFKGLNAIQRGLSIQDAWNSFTKPVAIGLDAARFDQRVSNSALLWEHEIYSKYYPGDKHFKRLMRLQRDNICVARCSEGKVKYRTKHNRMSGDSNTSLGNVLIMCSLIHQLFNNLNLKARLVNDGDDCVIIMEDKDLVRTLAEIPSFFSTAGFKVVVEDPVWVLEQIVFCQSQPVRVGEQYMMVRDPRTSISKDLVSLKPLDNLKIKEKWLSAVGDGGLALSSGVPIMQEFYSCLKRNAHGAVALKDPTLEGGFFRLSQGMSHRYTTILPSTRLSFWMAFGLTPGEQIVLEDFYKDTVILTGDINHRFVPLPV